MVLESDHAACVSVGAEEEGSVSEVRLLGRRHIKDKIHLRQTSGAPARQSTRVNTGLTIGNRKTEKVG